MSYLLTIKEASEFATSYIRKNITTANITYLVNYGKINKLNKNGNTVIHKNDLIAYYNTYKKQRELAWKDKLGQDLNWALSFDHLKEADTTKHVHRLHPYKGKFIPQLVEYFLDAHTDDFKTRSFFQKEDIVLDPFCGSGTMLVQANELGMHGVGIDVSIFNTLMANVKIQKIDFAELQHAIIQITEELKYFISKKKNLNFELAFTEKLGHYNRQYFPSPDFKIKVHQGKINEQKHYQQHRKIIEDIYYRLISDFQMSIVQTNGQIEPHRFIEKWYLQPVRDELDFLHQKIKTIQNSDTKKVLAIILSRTIRSCRATPHGDLATLKEPVIAPYYCAKHGKVCKPLFSLWSWWQRYTKDTVHRFQQFANLRTDTHQVCLHGDSQNVDIIASLQKKHPKLFALVQQKKIKGIFSSPPYVGLIDYHEQHSYAYDLFGFERRDDLEIGPLAKRQSKQSQREYVVGVANVLLNCKPFLQQDYHVFLVANDKFNLYPEIAERAGMRIVERYKRPVLNRTEKDRGAYGEIVFYMRENNS